jgi:hypothetical protein
MTTRSSTSPRSEQPETSLSANCSNSGPTYKTWYDSANNVTQTQIGNGGLGGIYVYSPNITRGTQTVTCTYGPNGNVLKQTADGFSNSTSTTCYYDASKYFQKESVEDPNGNVPTFDYFDNADMSPGNRGTTEITYESGNDRVASVEDPVTGTVSYTYLLNGARATMSLPGGGTWTYSYLPYNMSGDYFRVQPRTIPTAWRRC